MAVNACLIWCSITAQPSCPAKPDATALDQRPIHGCGGNQGRCAILCRVDETQEARNPGESDRLPHMSSQNVIACGMVTIPQSVANAILDTQREPLLVLDGDLRVQFASRSFYGRFQVTPQQTDGRLVYELGNGQWNIPALRNLLEEVLPQNGHFDGFQVEHTFPNIGRRIMLLNARRLVSDGDGGQLIVLAFEDVTDRRRAEREADEKIFS